MSTDPQQPPALPDVVGEQFLRLLSDCLYSEDTLAAMRQQIWKRMVAHQQQASAATMSGRFRVAAVHEGHVDGMLEAWSIITGTPWVRRPDST